MWLMQEGGCSRSPWDGSHLRWGFANRGAASPAAPLLFLCLVRVGDWGVTEDCPFCKVDWSLRGIEGVQIGSKKQVVCLRSAFLGGPSLKLLLVTRSGLIISSARRL